MIFGPFSTHLDSQINVAISRDYSELREGGTGEDNAREETRASLIQKGSERETQIIRTT